MHNARSVRLMRSTDYWALVGSTTGTDLLIENGKQTGSAPNKKQTPSTQTGGKVTARGLKKLPSKSEASLLFNILTWLLSPPVQTPKATRPLTGIGVQGRAQKRNFWFRAKWHLIFLCTLLVTCFISFGVNITDPQQVQQPAPQPQAVAGNTIATQLWTFFQVSLDATQSQDAAAHASTGLEGLFSSILEIFKTAQQCVAVAAWIVISGIVSFMEVCPFPTRLIATLYAGHAQLQLGTPGPMRQYDGNFYNLPYSWKSEKYAADAELCLGWRQALGMQKTNFTLQEVLWHADNEHLISAVHKQMRDSEDPIRACKRNAPAAPSATVVSTWKPKSSAASDLKMSSNALDDGCHYWAVQEFENNLHGKCTGAHAVEAGASVKDFVHEISFCYKRDAKNAVDWTKRKTGCNCAWASMQFHITCSDKNGTEMPRHFQPYCSPSADVTAETEAKPCQQVQQHYCDFRFCVEDFGKLYEQERKNADYFSRMFYDWLQPSANYGMPAASFPPLPAKAMQVEEGLLVTLGHPGFTWIALALMLIWFSSQFNDLQGALVYTNIEYLQSLCVIAVFLLLCTSM